VVAIVARRGEHPHVQLPSVQSANRLAGTHGPGPYGSRRGTGPFAAAWAVDQVPVFLADALLAQGRLDEAARENRQVLALEPQNYHAHDNLATVYSAQGLKQDAVKEYRLSLAIKPDQAMTHYNIARIFMQSHQLPEAKEELTQSLRYDPNYADAHNDLGAVLIQLGDFDHAIEQFSDAARINPSYAGARQNLTLAQAHVKAKMGKQTGK